MDKTINMKGSWVGGDCVTRAVFKGPQLLSHSSVGKSRESSSEAQASPYFSMVLASLHMLVLASASGSREEG